MSHVAIQASDGTSFGVILPPPPEDPPQDTAKLVKRCTFIFALLLILTMLVFGFAAAALTFYTSSSCVDFEDTVKQSLFYSMVSFFLQMFLQHRVFLDEAFRLQSAGRDPNENPIVPRRTIPTVIYAYLLIMFTGAAFLIDLYFWTHLDLEKCSIEWTLVVHTVLLAISFLLCIILLRSLPKGRQMPIIVLDRRDDDRPNEQEQPQEPASEQELSIVIGSSPPANRNAA